MIHLEDLYPGWDGLAAAAEVLADWVTGPLGRGPQARWRRFDWDTMSYAEWHTAGPADVIILEGCGSIRAGLASVYAARIWVEAPAAARRQRLRARPDWAAYAPHAERWANAEDRLYQAEQNPLPLRLHHREPGRRRGGDGHGPAAAFGGTVKPRADDQHGPVLEGRHRGSRFAVTQMDENEPGTQLLRGTQTATFD